MVVSRPRSIACCCSVIRSCSLAFASRSQYTGIQTAMITIRRMPHAWSRSRFGFSRSGSEGPGFMPGGMSGPPRRRWNRGSPTRTVNTMSATVSTAATTISTVCQVVRASIIGAPPAGSYAERALGGLVDRVGPPRRAGDDLRGVHLDRVAVHGDREPHQPVGGRAQLPLARVVVLRAVAGAFEPLALVAERDAAPEVRALLVQRHEVVRGDAHVRAARI